MMLFYLAILFLVLLGVTFFLPNGRSLSDVMSKAQCNVIKGVCILLVFIRHVWPYVLQSGYPSTSLLDKAGSFVNGGLGQLLVVPFLFFSGYGVMESIRRKGGEYVRTMPRRRILTTLVNFDVAVLVFAVLAFARDVRITPSRFALSLIGWSDIGNSNWYIFDILLCYVASTLSFAVSNTRVDRKRGLAVLFLLSFVVVFALRASGKHGYWYSTFLCFAAGAVFSHEQDVFERLVTKHWFSALLLMSPLFLVFHVMSYRFPLFAGNLAGIIFSLLLVVLLQRIEVRSRPLEWLGEHLFPLYIYQRVPMILLQKADSGGFAMRYPLVYVILCLAATLVIAFAYRFWRIRLD